MMHAKQAKDWLTQAAYPFWDKHGVDRAQGVFEEALTVDGKPSHLPRRSMVQARQIYSFCLGEKIGALGTAHAKDDVQKATNNFLAQYSQSNGSFALSVDARGTVDTSSELYTQAFALFALANAYELVRDVTYKKEAKRLLTYLQRERRAPGGGYTERKNGKTLFEANPHMHLFEAAVAWMTVDPKDAEWKALADEILVLVRTCFVDDKTGALCEHFAEGWEKQREQGAFVFEPGHHFEWVWLLGLYQALTHDDSLRALRHTLFDVAEKHGIDQTRGAAVDEMWSDLRVKTASSRFWPHCERIKAAVQLGAEVPIQERAYYAKAADQAVATLFRYFENMPAGLWMDTWTVQGAFTGDPVKASSLYHIATALQEYIRLRGSL